VTVIPISPELRESLADIDWPSADRSPGTRRRTRLRITEIGALTLLALAGYIASGLWVRFGLHFWINDALNRTDDALYVTVGRDPHLGAIGFYWPPLPQLLQLPLMPFLRPFGEEILAGPLMSAACMAATIPVIARLGRRLELGRGTIFAICLAFAITPDMIYTASNGMAEACFILSGAVTMLGFITWIDTHSTPDLLVFTLGLSMLVMTRLEGPFIAVGLVAVAVVDLRNIKRSLWRATLLLLPPAACYGFWILVQWILLKDALFFLHQNGGAGPTVGQSFWLPPGVHRPSVALVWVLGWAVVLAPVLFLVVGSALLGPLTKRTRGSLGILAAIGVVLAIQFYTAIQGSVFGDPRYFVMAVIFGAVGALWLASGSRGWLPRAWNAGLVGLLVLAAGTGSYALTSGRVTHVEGECGYFQYGVAQVLPFLGRPQAGKYQCYQPANGLQAWQDADSWIDGHLSGRDRILADNGSDYAASLFSTRPNLFIVRNDRDWAKTVANPVGVTYIVTQSSSPTGAPSVGATFAVDEGATLLGLDPAGWHLVKSFAGALNVVHQGTYVQIWHFVPSAAAGPTPTGTQAALR
jgi:hypothetical protein